jgi:xanthine dehydrogenase accessory factor
VLGSPGTSQLRDVMVESLRNGEARRTVTVEIHGKAVVEAGLSCGGQADVLVQPADALPVALWDALAGRTPVAVVTPAAGPPVVVTGSATPPSEAGPLAGLAAEVLASGHSAVRSVEVGGAQVLVEAWVPPPRLVVVGDGDLVDALTSQAALLGWGATSIERSDGLDDALAWAGGSAALVVLSHDPHVDVPALRLALESGVGYVGAMGSRRTQSRRLERLAADGVDRALLDAIHRPVGLDLGGRSAPEVALAICAEILAARTGRDGRSLRDRTGPIHDRPAASDDRPGDRA